MSFVGFFSFWIGWFRHLACESDVDEFLRVCGVGRCPIRWCDCFVWIMQNIYKKKSKLIWRGGSNSLCTVHVENIRVVTSFARSVVSSYGINVKNANRSYLSQIATVENVEPKILITIPVQYTEQDKAWTQTNTLLQKILFMQLKPDKGWLFGNYEWVWFWFFLFCCVRLMLKPIVGRRVF
jgi:hypothetical protein